ncbi:MAG: TIGR01212 family radical SAM protein [Chitinivibrionales bacterium]|nr:TIGR01212 family radical SAM protein [Chitinivibrionales bacterium]
MHNDKRYYDLNTYLRERFGQRVQKITIDAGFTCPNRDGTRGTGGCIYCNARGSGTGASARGLSIREQLEQGKQSLQRRYKARAFIAYFQAFSNTYGSLDRLRGAYDEALSVDGVVGLSIGTRPDCVDGPTLDLLQSYLARCMVWVEYGVQSMHTPTLERINRGHGPDVFVDAVTETRRRDIAVCAHLILGLPGESRRDMAATARAVAALGVDGVKLHLLYVVRGTPLERLYRAGEYRCMAQDEYVEAVCDMLERLDPRTVVQRLTGDPHPEELVAPEWSLRKQETLARIHACLLRRDTRQGSRFAGGGSVEPA